MPKDSNPYCHCLCFSANALARNITRISETAFASTGLAPSLAFVLMTVNRRPGIQPSEVARIMMLSPSTVSRLVEKLEAKGLLRREGQGRTILIHSTPAGEGLFPALQEAWRQTHAAYSGLLGEETGNRLTEQVYAAALALEPF
ncbi:MAG: MarR family transcriptional regulator [Holophaga sp.]|nr:MarR family transcriptional regulator [Holophaga sp.]